MLKGKIYLARLKLGNVKNRSKYHKAFVLYKVLSNQNNLIHTVGPLYIDIVNM